MSRKLIPSHLKTIFQAHFVITGAVGLQHLFLPRWWTDLAGIEVASTLTWRVIGAALLAFAVSSWLSSRRERWSSVRIIVLMEIVWSFLCASVIIWGIVAEGTPPLEWLNVALLIAFGALFSYFFVTEKSPPMMAD